MKNKLVKIYLTVLAAICGANGSVSGQIPIPAHNPTPVVYSPQTSDMMRYDAMPVNMSTGRIDLNIPLVDIQDRDFKFPITLSYNSDGFKPTQADNFVGHSWALRCGGMIYREVRGIPDDINNHSIFVRVLEDGGNEYHFDGFMKLLGNGRFNMDEMRSNVDKNPYKYARSKDEFAPMPTIPSTNIESAPDMYYFNFGNHSGKFMINYDGTVSVVGYDGHHYEVDLSDYQMANSLNAHSTIIRIKTDDGYVYTFGGTYYGPVEYSVTSWTQNTTVPEYQAPTSYGHNHKHTINAWHLSEIKAPNGRLLTIHYKDVDENCHTNLSYLLDKSILPESEWQEIASLYSLTGYASYQTLRPQSVPKPPGDFYTRKPNSYSYNLNKIAMIDYITVGSCRVDFHYSLKKQYSEMDHIHPGYYKFRGAQLDSLSVSYDNIKCQNHSFGYTYKCNNRLFLTSLKHSQRGTYQFKYNIPSINVHPTTSNIDHWGYWTGKSIEMDIMPGTRFAENFFCNDFKITTANRDPEPSSCDATLLNTVIYPTGGESRFEYEPHKYLTMIVQNMETYYDKSEVFAPGVNGSYAGGARIRKIKFYDGVSSKPVKETRYVYNEMEGVLTYMPLYRCNGFYLMDNNTVLGWSLENSNGIGRQFYPSQHILYQTVNEYYINPQLGTNEWNSPYKQTNFFIESHYYGYTDFVYNTYNGSEYSPYRYTLGNRLDLTLFYSKRFRWSGMNESFKNGKVLEEYYFDGEHNLKKSVSYQYKDVFQQNPSLCIYTESLQPGTCYGIYTHVNSEYFRMNLLTNKTVTEYNEYRSITWSELYEYDKKGYLTRQMKLLAQGDSLITRYKYLPEVPALLTDKQQTLRLPGKESRPVHYEHFDYRLQNSQYPNSSLYVASDYFTGTDFQHLEKRVKYLRYDSYGNPVEIEKDGISSFNLWGYNGQHLIAKIENATYEEVTQALEGNEPESVSDEVDYFIVANLVEGLRSKLPKAHVSNYTYQQGVGMISSTDPSGKTAFFEYDAKGRLVQNYRFGMNGEKEILQLNEYHIINE